MFDEETRRVIVLIRMQHLSSSWDWLDRWDLQLADSEETHSSMVA